MSRPARDGAESMPGRRGRASRPAPPVGARRVYARIVSTGVTHLPGALTAKLDELDAQFAQMERDLADPAVASDHTRLRDLSIKRAALAPVVEGYRRYRALAREGEELRAAIAGDDAELGEMARAELPGVERKAGEEIERVKAQLVTADDRKVGSVIL